MSSTTLGAGQLPEALQATVYRIVQESLTNSLKHAREATCCDVRVSVRDDEVVVRVSDDGDPEDAPALRHPGNGIRGMRERVDAFGGSISSGPAGRGWLVEATLGRTVPAAAP